MNNIQIAMLGKPHGNLNHTEHTNKSQMKHNFKLINIK